MRRSVETHQNETGVKKGLENMMLSLKKQAPNSGPPFKLTIGESIDRIKEEFNFLQAQYNRYFLMVTFFKENLGWA